MMTRKHFKALAESINLIRSKPARTEAAIAVAHVCMKFNPDFDATKFFEACGLYS